MIDVDKLSNEIRRVDGNHTLGAGALAEALMPFLSALPIAGEGKELVDVLRQGIKDQGYGYTMKGNRLTVSTDEVFAVDLDKLASFILSALISSPGKDGGQEVEAVAWQRCVPVDATPAMIAAALAVDWSNEDEEGAAHNIWHAMVAASPKPQPASTALVERGNLTCPCTTFQQDEDCEIGYPSLLCTACDGKGITTVDKVVALAAEMMKVAEQVDELEDPFAAWETIDLLKSENEQFRKLAALSASQSTSREWESR